MSVLATNPRFTSDSVCSREGPPPSAMLGDEKADHPLNKSAWVARAKVMGVVLAIGTAFAVGFATGGSSSSPEPVDISVAESPTPTLNQIFEANPDLGNLQPGDIEQIVSEYSADPAAWNDEFIPAEFVKLLLEEREEEEAEAAAAADSGDNSRRLGTREHYRKLSEASDLAKAAWQASQESGFPNPILVTEGALDDRGSVFKSGSRCYIVFDGSESFQDWISNLNLGTGDILSVNRYNERDSSCPCERRRLWWCARRAACPVKRVLGRGYNGFRRPWNRFAPIVHEQVKSKCAGVSDYVFTGFSRGGALAAIGAAAFYTEGLIPASKLKLVTFGCPRAVVDSFSDQVHNKFVQERLVYKNDPVPTLPYGWMGYKHYGTHICRGCRVIGRDRPTVTNPVGIPAHLQYPEWIV